MSAARNCKGLRGSGLGRSGATLTPNPVPPNPLSYTPRHLADKILTARAALEGERKQVTVLFADVKGSMELAEQQLQRHSATKSLEPKATTLANQIWPEPSYEVRIREQETLTTRSWLWMPTAIEPESSSW
jgi:hypothetical protein